jgi:hypothetical protein
VNITVKPSDLVEEFVRLRDEKKRAEDTYKTWLDENYNNRMNEIELTLLDTLNQLGSDSISSPAGTAYKKLSVSVTTADGREFRRHVIGGELWDLIEFRPAKTAVNDLVERGEPVPPGLNRSTFFSIGIRRKS